MGAAVPRHPAADHVLSCLRAAWPSRALAAGLPTPECYNRRVRVAVVLASLLLGHVAACTPPRDPSVIAAAASLEDPLVGTTPDEWTTEHWLNSPPLTLASLRGRVVLVRWFMSGDCPLCTGTAPSLRALHADYASRGLVVVGLYHHHGDSALQPGEYEGYVRRFGFTFPVAVDINGSTVERWWLRGQERDFTSASFLVDRHGRVRAVHPGGSYAPTDPVHLAIRGAVEQLIAEP